VAATSSGKKRLSALLSAAMALPGVSKGAGLAPGTQLVAPAIDYSHSEYSESDGRMDVSTDQVSLTVPYAGRWQTRINYIKDHVTGASPVIYFPGEGGEPRQVLTSATIVDNREVYDITQSYFADEYNASVNVGRSLEDDYESNFVSLNYSRYANDKNTTFLAGISRDADEVWTSTTPDNPFFEPPVFRNRYKSDVTLGISQLLDANSQMQVNLTYSRATGFLADPYKSVHVTTNPPFVSEDDTRPNERRVITLAGRYARYFPGADGALHAEYRINSDTWSAESHTLELKWSQGLGSGWIIAPGLRYYSQQNAFFYAPFFTEIPEDGNLSHDYRLASFGAISGKLSIYKQTANFHISLDLESYERRKQWNLIDGAGFDVDDYSFNMYSLNVTYQF